MIIAAFRPILLAHQNLRAWFGAHHIISHRCYKSYSLGPRWRRRRCALPCPDNISTIVGAAAARTPSRRRRARVATAASRRYVRVKRKNTTVFLNVEKSDSFGGIKAKLAEILGADAEKIHLYTSRDESTETVDTAFVDNFCESDVVVYMKMDGDKGIEVDEPPKPSA